MIVPQKLPPAYPLAKLRQWLNGLRDAVAANTVKGDNKTILANRAIGGTTVSTVRSGGGGGGKTSSSTLYAKITGTTTTWVYTATIYTQLDDTGAPHGSGTSGQTVKVPTDYLASGEVIPNDTILECRKVIWAASSTLATTTTYYTATQHLGLI